MYQWILVAAMSNPWALQSTPSSGTAEAIGGYAAGCLQGAVAVPEYGTGYQILRPKQKRYYGHPIMRQYVLDLARQARKMGHLTFTGPDAASVRERALRAAALLGIEAF